MTRLVRGSALAAIMVLAVWLPGCALTPEWRLPGGVVYPSITLDQSVSGIRSASHTFRFEGRNRTVTVDIDESLYAGAKAATKSVVRFGGAREDDWIEEYYPAFIWEEHQELFFAELLRELRAIRDVDDLGPDRYADLLTVFVQSLEYRTDPVDLEPKFPVETFAETAGDCDDKTLLLAGLLSREGYDVAIMLFEQEQHVSLGIRAEGAGYRDTGYAFVETTAPALVGMVPETFADGIVLQSMPRIFPVDGGATGYGASHEVDAILEAFEKAGTQITTLATEITRAESELSAFETSLAAESARLDSLRSSERTTDYNAAVPAYNALVAEFNDLAAQRNELANERNLWIELQNRVAENLDDRAGTYRYIMSSASPLSR